ncbi:MAG: SCP2 sterol-binding domain-containing protein [Anaerolineae bacterium]
MAVQFGTDDWIKALMTEVNNDEAYRTAAKDWEGDFCFVVERGQGVPEPIYMYMDLWHGECREAYKVADPASKDPAFVMNAPMGTWRKVFDKKLDPIRGLMSRQLKLKGNMMKVMKAPKAAIALVECCTRIETEYPAS